MTPHQLSRTLGHARPRAPVRIVHLGLGNFFRAHPCWYTEHAADAEGWGIAAFAGRGARDLVDNLNAQDDLFTVVSRGADRDTFEVVGALSSAHHVHDTQAWLTYMASPQVAAVTITVTEAGYLRATNGGLDVSRHDVQSDIQTLRRAPTTGLLRTAPGRLVAGIAARQRASAGPLALVPCDNTPGNGQLVRQVVADLAALVDDDLARWTEESVTVVSTMVDRITPGTQPADLIAVAAATGLRDHCPVVTEPFHQWVLSGRFPSGRPQWQDAGATFTDDVRPYEDRKLWLLNGAHSLLAYAAPLRGHATVAEAVQDRACQEWLEQWWQVAAAHLDQPPDELAAYQVALMQRFTNARMNDRLDRIAADGSHKLPIRILPVLRAERAAGRLPPAATLVLAAWVCHLRGLSGPIRDAGAAPILTEVAGPLRSAVIAALAALDPALADDADMASQVYAQSRELAQMRGNHFE